MFLTFSVHSWPSSHCKSPGRKSPNRFLSLYPTDFHWEDQAQKQVFVKVWVNLQKAAEKKASPLVFGHLLQQKCCTNRFCSICCTKNASFRSSVAAITTTDRDNFLLRNLRTILHDEETLLRVEMVAPRYLEGHYTACGSHLWKIYPIFDTTDELTKHQITFDLTIFLWSTTSPNSYPIGICVVQMEDKD